MKVSLVVQTPGKAAGQAISVASAQFLIGRDPQCNLRPGSAMISKRHCAVLVKEGRVFLRDFDSTNGTFLNDNSVKGEVSLKDGDILKVGPLLFKVAIEGALPPPPPKPAPVAPPKKADIMDGDEDAAAMMLDLGEDSESSSAATTETSDAVPEGTTVMEMPAIQAMLEKAAENKAAAEVKTTEAKLIESKPAVKPPESKPAEAKAGEEAKPAEAAKPKPKTGAAQDAAKALLERMRQGSRKKA